MNYPVWQLGFPGGLLIAVIAVLHVFVSHFAVGGGAYLVLTEHRAYRSGDAELLAYVRRHAKFFALLTLVFGAISGVGIWFVIGLVSPEGTSSLIHTYVWGWAIEWVFFFVEITAALIYAYQWDRLDRRTHLAIGWIYFGAAWASLVVINGIITYMLTPGAWLQTHAFWDGFFNPTYLPSLFIRTAMCVALAGIFGLLTAARLTGEVRERVARWAGAWAFVGIAALPLCAWWYFSLFPAFSKEYIAGLIPAAQQTVSLGIRFSAAAALIALIFIIRPRLLSTPIAVILMIAGLGTMASGEYLREFVRKPWVIQGYIYANDVRAADVPALQNTGVSAKWFPAQVDALARGHDLFVLQCSACHGLDGYRAMRTRVRGWDAAFAADMLAHIHLTRGAMPPFAGNAADRSALGAFLATLAPIKTHIDPANEFASGKDVFEVHCAMCHTVGTGTRRPLSFTGMDQQATEDMIQMLDQISPNMPHFPGNDAERHALARYLREVR